MRSKTVQLCRDDDGWWVVCPLLNVKPVKINGEWEQIDRKGLDRREHCHPRGLIPILGLPKLKPGEGPRKIEITAKFVD